MLSNGTWTGRTEQLMIIDWPEPRPDLADLSGWLVSVLPGSPIVHGPIEILRFKRWGATAVFEADGVPVVVKHAQPVLYPDVPAIHRVVSRACPAATAPLLAEETANGWQRTVFALVPGRTASEVGPQSLPAVAAALGTVQAAVARTDLAGLPGYRVAEVPDALVADLHAEADQDADLLAAYEKALPVLRDHALALADVPASLDHPDLNDSNAIVDNDTVVLLDWEEAVVGCPLRIRTAG